MKHAYILALLIFGNTLLAAAPSQATQPDLPQNKCKSTSTNDNQGAPSQAKEMKVNAKCKINTVTTTPVDIPKENQEMGTIPPMAEAEAMAQLILKAINAVAPSQAEEAFFPRAAFLRLKEMPGAERYYDQLVTWFKNDLEREHKTAEGKLPLTFVAFKPGRCRWKPVNSEYNKVAYWSCSRSTIELKNETMTHTIKVVTMINWGTKWYVTHLGPIPKQ